MRAVVLASLIVVPWAIAIAAIEWRALALVPFALALMFWQRQVAVDEHYAPEKPPAAPVGEVPRSTKEPETWQR